MRIANVIFPACLALTAWNLKRVLHTNRGCFIHLFFNLHKVGISVQTLGGSVLLHFNLNIINDKKMMRHGELSNCHRGNWLAAQLQFGPPRYRLPAATSSGAQGGGQLSNVSFC